MSFISKGNSLLQLPQSPRSLLDFREDEKRGKAACWYALYTRSRHEKFVDLELTRRGVRSFLPLRRVTRDWSDRRKIIEQPLFQGYLFVHISIRECLSILKIKGAVRFVGRSLLNPTTVPESDITSIQRFIEQEIEVDPFPYIKEGARVYVRSGPFKGIEGFVVRKDKHCRLVISLNLLMQSVSIQIDQACVEPV